jgi:capsular exopolysaccharide synthesis family protein
VIESARNENVSGGRAADPHLRDYLRVLFIRRWIFIGTLAAVLMAGALYALGTTPIYRASATILLQPTQARVVDIKEVYDPTFGAAGNQVARREFLETQYMLMLSDPIMDRLLDDSDLKLATIREFRDRRAAAGRLKRRFEVKGFRNTYVAEVSFEWRNSELAQRTLSRLIEEYMASSRQRSVGVTAEGLDNLRAKSEELRPRLEACNDEIDTFLTANNMVSVEQSQDVVTDRLRQINNSVTEAEIKRIQTETRQKTIKDAFANNANPQDIPEVSEDTAVRDLRAQLTTAKLKAAEMNGSLGANHPEMQAATASMTTLQEKLDQEMRRVLSSAEADVLRARVQERELRAELDRQKEAVLELNRVSGEYRILKDMRENLTRDYNAIVQRVGEIEIAMAAGAKDSGVYVITPARVDAKPVRPQRGKAIVLSFALGVVLGIGLCFLVEYFDTSVKTKEDVEACMGAPVIGYVPEFDEKGETGRELLIAAPRHSAVSEAFRSIRTALSFLRGAGKSQSIVFTSSVPSEGKTFCCSNLAVTLAQTGKRVVVIDADMRRPRVHKVFQCDNLAGMSNLLAGQEDVALADVVRKTEVPNLDLITSGPIPPNPSELLSSQRAVDLVKELLKSYDYVMIDSPPVVGITDAAILSALTEGVVLVVRSFATDREILRHAKERLDTAGVKVLGVILNCVDAPKRGTYYYGQYYYHYYSHYRQESGEDDGGKKGSRRKRGA